MAVARPDENAFSPFGNFQSIDGANVPPFGGRLRLATKEISRLPLIGAMAAIAVLFALVRCTRRNMDCVAVGVDNPAVPNVWINWPAPQFTASYK
jgi:hypothetical protein